MTPLAQTLLHFLWEGAALAALASTSWTFCRSASSRHAVGVATLALMPATFLATLRLLRAEDGSTAGAISSYAAAVPLALPAQLRHSVRFDQVLPAFSPHYGSWLVAAWLLGVAVMLLRSGVGVLLVERLRRRETVPLPDELHERCVSLQRRMRVTRTVRYVQSARVDAPLALGWARPVIILPADALTLLTGAQLEGVVAHELAHVRRWDGLVNLGQVVVEAIFFHHPAVAWLGRRVRAERENSCDDVAVAMCKDALAYSSALTQMAEWEAAPRLAMAANRGPLVGRIARLLRGNADARSFRFGRFSMGLLSFACALVAGTLFVGCLQRGESREVSFDVRSPQGQTSSYIDSLRNAGLAGLTVDNLVGMKIHGVTGDYVRQIHELGLFPSPDDFIGLKIHGVSPAYVKGIQEHGEHPDADEIIQLKIRGISPESLLAFKRASARQTSGSY